MPLKLRITFKLKILVSYLLVFGSLAYLTGPQSIAQSTTTYLQLKKEFKSPPSGSRPKVYYWWLNGNVDTIRVKEEIAAMDKAGISGFDIFEIGVRSTDTMVQAGPAFLSKESLKSIEVALVEAKKYDMDVGLNMASSWNAGGSWITPEHSAKSIYYSKIEVNGKSGEKIKLPFPEISEKDAKGKPRKIEFQSNGRPVFYKEVAVVAIPLLNGQPVWDPAKIIDVSENFDSKSEKLDWNLSGDWEVHRYICSNSGEQLKQPSQYSLGPIIDHFDAQATEVHFLYIINRLKEVMGDLRNTALKSLYLASYEATGFVWTTTLPEVFMEINGYKMNSFLPVLFNEEIFDDEVVKKFRKDHQRTLSELMINNFYKKGKEIANKHGLKINSESGGPGLPLHNVPVEPLKSLGVMDLPRGEFWINHSRFNEEGIDISRVVKEVSAASHIYDRGIVEEEAFTTFQHWQEGPSDMKPYGDRAFAEGMNRVVVHGFSHTPSRFGSPGIAYHAGTHYNDKRIWYSKVRPFNDYLARISFILQHTDFFADVLFYYGDAIPNYGGHKNSRFTVGPGYDYEMTNTEVLLQLEVKNGKLMLPGGAQFSVLVLEDEKEINPQVLLKLDELVNAGAVVVGTKPEKVADIPGRTEEMLAIIQRLWNKGASNKVISDLEPIEVLNSMEIVPDLNYSDKEFNKLDYIHFSKDGLEFYFIRNTENQWVSREISFRQQDKIPEIWDPTTGFVNPISVYNQDNRHINLPLSLPPFGAVFVVFKPGKQQDTFTKIGNGLQHPPILIHTNDGLVVLEEGLFELNRKGQSLMVNNSLKVQPFTGAWEVYFEEEWGGPKRAIFPELTSWTESENECIKYYSGTARYEKTFKYDVNASSAENERIYLDLGDLSKIGEVWLNGKSLGITWTKPHRFDITNVLVPGFNELVVEIGNVWSNRITGDQLTEGKDYTFTNIPETVIDGLNRVRVQWKDAPLIQSGLFGPVKIETVNLIK